MIKMFLSLFLCLFSLGCQLVDNSINGRYASDEALPAETVTPPPLPTFTELGISVKSSVLGLTPIIDETTGTIRFNNIPGGRFVGINFHNEDISQAPLSCLNLPSYAFISYGTLSVNTPPSSVSKVLIFNCLYQDVDLMLELQVEASSISLISSSSFLGKSFGVNSYVPQITDDGKWAVFMSYGFTLTGNNNIFRKNLVTGELDLISSSDGVIIEDNESTDPQITPDGRWVVFSSDSTNLVVGGGGGQQIYLKDLNSLSSPAILVSSTDSTQADQTLVRGNGVSSSPQITPDGRWVVFTSASNNFVSGGSDYQIYLKDLNNPADPPILLSSIDSTEANQTIYRGGSASDSAQITPDGRWVVFSSSSANLVSGGAGGHIFLKDLNNLSVRPVLLSSLDSTELNQTTFKGDGLSEAPQITDDGRWVVFTSASTNFVTGGGDKQVYLKDLTSLDAAPLIVSSLDATQADQTNYKGNNVSVCPQITPDGRWIVFSSLASNFPSDGKRVQIYLKDLNNLASPLITLSSLDSTQANQADYVGDGSNSNPQITPNARWVIFESKAHNFIVGGGGYQIYLKDLNNLSSPPVILSTLDSNPIDQSSFKGNNVSITPQITADGRWVIFSSISANFVLGGQGHQIYLKDLSLLSAQPILLSSSDPTQEDQSNFRGVGTSYDPQITSDGRWVIFRSNSSNFVFGGTGGFHIYLKDTENLSSPAVLLSSRDSTDADQTLVRGDGNNYPAQITDDGRWVVFSSNATNFVTGGGGYQIYLKDLNNLSSPPLLVSSEDSTQSDQTNWKGDDDSYFPQITPDGRWVVFTSSATNFILGGSGQQIYLKDLTNLADPPLLISSRNSNEADQTLFKGNVSSTSPQITPDGTLVVFSSDSTNFVTGGTDSQIYLKDLSNLASPPVNLSSIDSTQEDQTNFEGNYASNGPQITPDGKWMIFSSHSSNFGSTLQGGQIYLKDLTNISSTPTIVSSIDSSQVDQSTFRGNRNSYSPQITPEGRWVVFQSYSTNFVLGGGTVQIYLKDLAQQP